VTWLAGIVLLLLVILVALQLVPRIQAHRALGRTLTGIPGPLGEAIDDGDRVLAVFSSPACPACRAQGEAVDLLRKNFSSVHTINVVEQPALARTFGIMVTPTSVLVQRGRVRAFLVGIQSAQKLRTLLSHTTTP